MKNNAEKTFRYLDSRACPTWALFVSSQFALSWWECAIDGTDLFNIAIQINS